MDLGVISVRYARALLKGALAEKQEDELYKEMQILYKSYLEVPELRTTIDNPMLANEIACGDDTTNLTKLFIDLVLKKDREFALQFMAASYITLYRKFKNITRGKLITAADVSLETVEKMKRMVENRTRGTVEFNTEVDKELIGGFVLEYDDYRMNASVKSKLRRILSDLKK